MYITIAAMAAVEKNVPTVMPMMRPARFAELIFAIAEAMEQNTIGTTTQNIMLMNSVPKGSRAVAPGQTAPTTQPATMPSSISVMKPYFFINFFIAHNLHWLFSCFILLRTPCKVNAFHAILFAKDAFRRLTWTKTMKSADTCWRTFAFFI